MDKFDSSYQREPGFRRIKAKASGRSLAHKDAQVQIAGHLHLRENGQPKTELVGSDGETLYVLYVSWLEERAFLDLRRVKDGAWVAYAVGPNEGVAWDRLDEQIETLGI
jgi:hypothetical protein